MRVREYCRAVVAEVGALEADGWHVVGGSTFADRQLSILLVREIADRDSVDADRDSVDAPQLADTPPDLRAPGRPRCDDPSHGRSTAPEGGQPLARRRGMDRTLQALSPMTPELVALLDDATNLTGLLWLLSDATGQRGDADTRNALRLAARAAEAIVEQLQRLDARAEGGKECPL